MRVLRERQRYLNRRRRKEDGERLAAMRPLLDVTGAVQEVALTVEAVVTRSLIPQLLKQQDTIQRFAVAEYFRPRGR